MASVPESSHGYSKRKRAPVKYYDTSESEDDDFEYDGFEEVETPTKKVCSHSPHYQHHPSDARSTKLKGKDAVAKASSKPLPKKKIFPFNSLPAELKNQIYGLTLTDPNGIYLISRTKQYHKTVMRDTSNFRCSSTKHRRRGRYYGSWRTSQAEDETKPVLQLASLRPNIMLLNREIFAETQPLLYSSNQFFFEDTTAMYAFLATIGSKNCATLTDLTIKGWGETRGHKAMNHPAFTLLGNAINLHRLHVDCHFHYGGPTQAARYFYREVNHYLHAIGREKGQYDAAIGLIEVEPKNIKSHRWPRTGEDATPEEDLKDFRTELRALMRVY